MFLKPETALGSASKPFRIPEFSTRMHYEGELVFRFGLGGRSILEADALEYPDAVTVGIDWTERDLQDNQKAKGLPWEISKAFDDSAVVGDWRPMRDPSELTYEFSLNGVLMQRGDPRLMLYPVATQIAYISRFFTIEPGDLLFTGTPKGVEAVKSGDVLVGALLGEKLLEVHVE